MNADQTVETLSEQFSNLSAEDLENLDVEELEQRLELAAIDYTAALNATFNFLAEDKFLPDCEEFGKWAIQCW